MKRLTLLMLIAAAYLFSCNSKNSSKQLLTAKNLNSVFIFLNAGSAYNLKTPKGAILKIAKNSFDVKGNEKVKLEIKEAYSAADILLAGLSTKSNGKLLQSGGMIYINATANDKAVNILKPINVSIPSEVYDERMQLFTGEIENDSSINWVDPKPLDTAPAARRIINGSAMFKANCGSCHKPTADFTGPALAGCREREPDRDWAYRFTKNPSAMQKTDKYANALFRKYMAMMTAFPNLKRGDVNAILDYCDNEARLNPRQPDNTSKTGSTVNINTSASPCIDSAFYPLPDTNIQALPIDTMPDSSGIIYPEKGLTDVPIYQFNIDRSGWYNIDCFIDNNRELVMNVKLEVDLEMPKELNVEIYLCIPKRKLLTNGYEMKNKKYRFYNDDSIPLILNDEAIIFAFAADSSKAYYGISRFKVQNSQNIVVDLKASTKEDILSAIKSNKLDGVKIEIEKPETYIRFFNVSDTSTALDTLKQKKMQMQIFEVPCNYVNTAAQISQLKY